jgi:hypothetical protein
VGCVGGAILAAYLYEQRACYPVGDPQHWRGFTGELMANPQKVGLLLEKTLSGTRNHRMLVFKVV